MSPVMDWQFMANRKEDNGLRQLITQNGFFLDETISALQKEIRRGNEKSAMMLALEMIPRYEKYMWRRLLVITVEDIGPGNPNAHVQVRSLRDSYFEFRAENKSGTARLLLANAIIIMCRSPKSRMGDHLQCTASVDWHNGQLEIPDYALDKHTAKGRRAGRDVEHWLMEGCKLVPEAELDDPHKEQAQKNWMAGWKGPEIGGKPTKGNDPDPEDPGQADLF